MTKETEIISLLALRKHTSYFFTLSGKYYLTLITFYIRFALKRFGTSGVDGR
jgi:hypothetical protein